MDYVALLPEVADEQVRWEKARQIQNLLRAHGANGRVLDYGCSTGVMTACFAEHGWAVGVDVDRLALAQARQQFPRIAFLQLADEQTMFQNATFDIVIANQVYNCVADQPAFFAEIYRVLKPGGVCFFGGRNKYALVERQYHLPFLSWLPLPLARAYVWLVRRQRFIGSNYRSYQALRRLTRQFQVHDYTLEVLRHPQRHGFHRLVRYSWLFRLLPLTWLRGLIPNYLWLLEKAPASRRGLPRLRKVTRFGAMCPAV